MSTRSFVEETISGLIDFATAQASTISTVAKSTILTLRANLEGDGSYEEVDDAEDWGSWALLTRPAAPDSDGACEFMILRRGDELIGIASKDRRWQITLEEGEAVLRAGSSSGAIIHVKPDGTIKLGTGATEGIGLGDAIAAHFDAIKTVFDNHIHLTTATEGSGPTVGTITPPVTGFAATPAVASSKHTVET